MGIQSDVISGVKAILNKEVFKEVDEILKNLKYIDIYIKEKEYQIEKIKNGDRGAIQAVCNDLFKSSPTNSISSRVENEVISRDRLIAQLEGEIYEQGKNRRLVINALSEMGESERFIYQEVYQEEKLLSQIAQENNCSVAKISYMRKDFINKMAIVLLGPKVLEGER